MFPLQFRKGSCAPETDLRVYIYTARQVAIATEAERHNCLKRMFQGDQQLERGQVPQPQGCSPPACASNHGLKLNRNSCMLCEATTLASICEALVRINGSATVVHGPVTLGAVSRTNCAAVAGQESITAFWIAS